MSQIVVDERLDRLFNLLPAVYRERDAELNGPLQALLRVVTEQVNAVEDDIAQLFENWFIETCQDWVVPYIGDLVGYRHAAPTGEALTAGLERWLVPRRDVANTVRSRRRKGTLAVLEELARDVAGWPARAVEGARAAGFDQSMNHLRFAPPKHLRGRTVDLRVADALERVDSAFDQLGHTIDVRRPNSGFTPGWHDLLSVAVFVWRLGAYSVTHAPATCLEDIAPHCYSFSALGHDAALYAKPAPETDPAEIATEWNLPVPIRRRALEEDLKRVSAGETSRFVPHSFQLWRGRTVNNKTVQEEVPAAQMVAADLRDWLAYQPERGAVAVDPERGRIAFHPDDRPDGVWVTYHYGFPDDLGGGEYLRAIRPSAPWPGEEASGTTFFVRVGARSAVKSIEAALECWDAERLTHPHAIIEIADSDLYRERLEVTLRTNERLTIRAADGQRPVIELTDRYRNRPDALLVRSDIDHPGGCLTLDGVIVTGRALHIEGPLCEVTIRHSTLVPGWGLEHDCEPTRPSEPSIEIYNSSARICLEHSIVGAIRVRQDEVRADPVNLCATDSVIDATSLTRPAIAGVGSPCAFVNLRLERSTVFGTVHVHSLELASNSIFASSLRVARRQVGCVRFSYVPDGSRTLRRYRCQPETAVQALLEAASLETPLRTPSDLEQRLERERVKPSFENTRYGTPTYARLSLACAPEITQGADDESEMGVYHDLYEPQRTANLQLRLEEFVPAGFDVGVLKSS